MAVKIRPLVLEDAAGYRRCYDTIAKERRYLFGYKAPPLSTVRAQLRRNLRIKDPFVVAVDEERVVGWAAVFSPGLPSLRHNGDFLVRVLPAYRGTDLRAKLAAGVLKLARGKFDAVLANVFRQNKPARKLYKKLGFKPCGEIKRGVKLAYGLDDVLVLQKRLRR